MKVSKKSSLIWVFLAVGLFVLVVAIFSHPRLSILVSPQAQKRAMAAYGTPTQNARDFWQAREFASVGSFEDLDQQFPSGIILQSFPRLTDYRIDQVIAYTSKQIESVDLILSTEKARKVITYLAGEDIPINNSLRLTVAGEVFVLGYFDENWAKAANGYYHEVKDDEEVAWIQLSWIKEE